MDDSIRQLAGSCILVFLMLAVVAMRMVSRAITKAGIWWDDALTLLSMLQGIAALAIEGVLTGAGNIPALEDTEEHIKLMKKFMVALNFIYITCMCTVKLSVLTFYLRIFTTTPMRQIIQAVFAVVSLWTFGNILTTSLICYPEAEIWEMTMNGQCRNHQFSFIGIGIFNIITSIIIVALPVPSLWKLQMEKRRKIGLICCFLTGLGVTITAIVRMVYTNQVEDYSDFNRTLIASIHMTTVELNLAIICASLPMMWGLYLRFSPQQKLLNSLERLVSRKQLSFTHSTKGTSAESVEMGHTPPVTPVTPVTPTSPVPLLGKKEYKLTTWYW